MAVIVLGGMHPLILTVFLAALISAIMSSADSSLLAGSSLLCNNVIGSIWSRLSDQKLLMLTRVATVALTVIACYLALNVESIYKLMINSWASQLVIIFVPVITALYVPKATKNAGRISIITGTIGVVFWQILSGGDFFLGILPVVFGCGVGTLTFLIVNAIEHRMGKEAAPSAYVAIEE